MHPIIEALKGFTGRISYSTKVKIVLVFSSLLSLFAVVNLIRLQEPIQTSLKNQTALLQYCQAWTHFVSYLNDLNTSKVTPNYQVFSAAYNQFQQQHKRLSNLVFQDQPTIQMDLGELNASVYQLGIAILFRTLPPAFVNTQLVSLNDKLFHGLFPASQTPSGTDVPTYVFSHLLFDKTVPSYMSALLPSALHLVKENLLPFTPESILDAFEKQEPTKDNASLTTQLTLQNKLTQTLHALLEIQLKTLDFREWLSIVLVTLGILIVLTVYSTRIMRTPLASLRFAAQQLALGNLWQRATVDSHDEVAKMSQGFNTMVALLENAVSSTSIVSSKLTETISTIVGSAQSFEQNVSDQDQSITQIALNTVGITQTAKEVVQALEKALKVATITHEFAISAQVKVREIEIVLRKTATASQQIVETLSQLAEKVASLRAIITTIVNVADEANLLAINTALIAGSTAHRQSGFGIIASKIGDLASQTAFVTLKMEDSIKAILNALQTAGSQAHQLSKQMHLHSQAAARLVTHLNRIRQTASEQREICAKIRTAIQQQQDSAEQIHDTITLLSQGSKITTRSVKNLYSQIQYLSEASSNLQIIFDRFHLHP